jgi:prevent-host-death family protein
MIMSYQDSIPGEQATSAAKHNDSALAGAVSFTATAAKNEFGKILEKAMRGGMVVITKHDVPKAVLMSIEEYTTLSHREERKLNTLSSEFDALLERMQAPGARAIMQAAFDSTPKQLGKAAVWAARKRGK